MKGRAVVVVGLALAGCLVYSGCASTVEDPGTGAQAQYRWETLEAELDQGIAVVHLAARDAVDRLDLVVLRDGLDGIAAEILALDAHFDSVEIRLGALPGSGTLLMIRIGLFGDRNKSAVLFGSIMESLGRSGSTEGGQDLRCHDRLPDPCEFAEIPHERSSCRQ